MSDKLRVAIVDDTPDMRLLVRMSLELDPHIEVVAEAEDGRGAVDVAQRLQPDVMLLDLAMPVMDGMQALPEVVRASPDTAVLVLSGFAASTMAQDAVATGARGYLQKGLGAERLCERVWEASGRERPVVPLEDVFSLATEAGPSPDDPADPARDGLAARAAHAAPGGLAVLSAPQGAPAAEWVVTYLNPEGSALLGLTGDAVGRRPDDLAPGFAELLEGAAASRRLETAHGPLVVRTRRPERTPEEVVLSLVPLGEEVFEAEAEVQRLRSAIARTAHELRSPVGVIVGLSDAVQDGEDRVPTSQREEMRAALLRQSAVLERLTADLDAASQVQRGALAVELEHVDVAAVVRACLRASREAAFEIHAEDGALALADPSRLTQVLTNLVSNSRKYAEPPYEIHVRRIGDQVHLSVADRGAGVPEEFRPLLFEEFTRGHQDARGTGLGLFVVRSLAEALGGAVEFRPRDGGGSVFTVRLTAA